MVITHANLNVLYHCNGICSHAGTSCRLELVGGWQCWGVINDLAVLKGRGGSSGQKDSLVLAVRWGGLQDIGT